MRHLVIFGYRKQPHIRQPDLRFLYRDKISTTTAALIDHAMRTYGSLAGNFPIHKCILDTLVHNSPFHRPGQPSLAETVKQRTQTSTDVATLLLVGIWLGGLQVPNFVCQKEWEGDPPVGRLKHPQGAPFGVTNITAQLRGSRNNALNNKDGYLGVANNYRGGSPAALLPTQQPSAAAAEMKSVGERATNLRCPCSYKSREMRYLRLAKVRCTSEARKATTIIKGATALRIRRLLVGLDSESEADHVTEDKRWDAWRRRLHPRIEN